MSEAALLQAIIESPDDDRLRLVYADWLEENGEPERAEFIRVQCELSRLPEGDERRADLERRELALLPTFTEKTLEKQFRSFLNGSLDLPIGKTLLEQCSGHEVLPIMLSRSLYAIRADGTVIWFNSYDAESPPIIERNVRRRYGILFVGAELFPDLRLLIPPRPATSSVCRRCNGTGKESGFEHLRCDYCRGLKWTPWTP